MRCRNCQRTIPPTVKFCAYCGTMTPPPPARSSIPGGCIRTIAAVIAVAVIAIVVAALLLGDDGNGEDGSSTPTSPAAATPQPTAAPPVATDAPEATSQARPAAATAPMPTATPRPAPTLAPPPTVTPTATPRPMPTPTPTPAPVPLLAQSLGMKQTAAALTVYIETSSGTGSGFFYNRANAESGDVPDYVVATNQHVVEGDSNVKVCWALTQECVTGQVSAADRDFDIAVIEHETFTRWMSSTPGLWRTLLNWNGWGGSWAKGDVVYASGYPGGNKARNGITVSEPVVTEGTIVQDGLARYEDGYFIEHGADVEAGSSGGPLLNSAGRIVGINTGANPAAERLELAVPVGRFIQWMDAIGTGRPADRTPAATPAPTPRPPLPTLTPTPTLTPIPPARTPTPTPIDRKSVV